MNETNALHPRSKIWLEDSQGKVVFGFGRYKILKAIQRTGSLNAAAKELKMGYKAIWSRIHATENRLGQKLLIKKTGGPSGGGSALTPLAEKFLARFEKVQSGVEKKTNTLFEKDMGDQLRIKLQKKT